MSTKILLLQVVMGLFSSTLAQNSSTDLSRCALSIGELSPNARVNSTGMRSFRWQEGDPDWYLTTTLNDTRNPVLVSQLHDFQGYISAPMDTDAQVCVFMLNGINATVAGDNGCENALRPECVDFLKKNHVFSEQCQAPPERDALVAACGQQGFGSGYSSKPTDFSNQTCTILSPPANSMPSDYLTWPVRALSERERYSDDEADDFAYYDLYVRQTRPWVITREGKETQVLCVAPDALVEGSREPEGEWPPAGSPGNSGGRTEGVRMSVVLGVVGAVLMM
ncbi:hypothetical protein HBI67_143530 [Parastagonospora nodorum]|nr:hypothetical protein HBI67_143530 [Parastagonospora nodorum]KAH6086669.1 hypothetical protein HBI66_043600 [Parastagonospora nodorum]